MIIPEIHLIFDLIFDSILFNFRFNFHIGTTPAPVPPMGAGAVLGRVPSFFPALASATLLCKALIAEFDFIKRFTFLLNRPLILLFLMLSSAYVVLTFFLTVG